MDDELWAIVETPGGKIKRLSTSGIEFCDDITSELLDIMTLNLLVLSLINNAYFTPPFMKIIIKGGFNYV